MTEAGKSRLGLKVVIGCAAGCGLVLLLGGVALFGGLFWIFSPGRQVETSRIVGRDAVAVLRVDRTTEDPGVRALINRVLATMMQQQQAEQRQLLPESWRWMHDMSSAQSQPSGLSMYVPRSVTIAREPVEEGGEAETIVALNLRSMARMFRLMLHSMADEELSVEHRGYEIQWIGEDTYACFLDGTLLIATDLGAMQRAIDRTEADAGAAIDPSVESGALAPVATADWDIWLAAIDYRGDLGATVRDLLDRLSAEGELPLEDTEASDELPPEQASEAPLEASPNVADVDSLERVAVGIDVISDERMLAELTFDAGDAEAARRWLERLDGALDELARGGVDRPPLSIEVERSVSGERAVAEVTVSGLGAWVESAVEELLADEDL